MSQRRFTEGQLNALSYVLEMIEMSTVVNRSACYNAAMTDIAIHVKAAMERLASGKSINSLSETDTEGKAT